MNTKQKIRDLRLACPIIYRAYATYPDDEDEAIRVALLAHFEHSQSLMQKLVDILAKQPPTVFVKERDGQEQGEEDH